MANEKKSNDNKMVLIKISENDYMHVRYSRGFSFKAARYNKKEKEKFNREEITKAFWKKIDKENTFGVFRVRPIIDNMKTGQIDISHSDAGFSCGKGKDKNINIEKHVVVNGDNINEFEDESMKMLLNYLVNKNEVYDLRNDDNFRPLKEQNFGQVEFYEFVPTKPLDDGILEEGRRIEALLAQHPDKTEARRLVKARIGQGLFREKLIRKYGGQCLVTGVKDEGLLIASHIKPWGKCKKNSEKTDANNGLLLEARFDKLFDEGYITFDPKSGIMQVSEELDADTADRLGLNKGLRLNLSPQDLAAIEPYMAYHRKNIFRKK